MCEIVCIVQVLNKFDLNVQVMNVLLNNIHNID
jgi:hypothetical protein